MGVDEVGRGALAGDVIAAAVILPINHQIDGLIDSKRLSENRRIALYKDLLEKNKITVTVRRSRGKDIDAACGQLANK